MNDYEHISAHTVLDDEPKTLSDDEPKRKRILLGILGAFLGAVVGSIPWMIAYKFNWFIGILGTLIGICAKKGYDSFKGPEGKVKNAVIMHVSIIVVVLAQYVTTIFAIFIELQSELFAPTLIDSMYMLNELLINDPEIKRYFLVEIGIGIFFASFGLASISKDKKVEAVSDDTQLNDTELNDQDDLSNYNV